MTDWLPLSSISPWLALFPPRPVITVDIVMANRLFSPFPQFCDATGVPYDGGSLTFSASGTDTLLDTFSDDDLTVANANPVVLNSAGRPDTAIFLQNRAYKVVLKDANDVEIWTADPVYASDYSTLARVESIAGSPNGQLAGTAGSAGVPASMAWDTTNRILYVCTTTGDEVDAEWTAVNASTAAAVVLTPQGRLTGTSGEPVTTSDVSGATTIFYSPYVGNLVPINNGTSFVPTSFVELSLSLSSASANTNYDAYAFNNGGITTVGFSPAWSSATARGTGAGTTQLTRVSGLLVNAVSITLRNGASSYSVAANRATYLGSFRSVSAGQTHDSQAKRLLWNCYQRRPRPMQAYDATATWTYSTATFRQANGSTANQVEILAGLNEDPCVVRVFGHVADSASAGRDLFVGIGFDSTTVDSTVINQGVTGMLDQLLTPMAERNTLPGLGYHYFAWLERGGGAGTQTWFGVGLIGRSGILGEWFA